jgi:hypothetical protein
MADNFVRKSLRPTAPLRMNPVLVSSKTTGTPSTQYNVTIQTRYLHFTATFLQVQNKCSEIVKKKNSMD